jgi:hypothetical protein
MAEGCLKHPSGYNFKIMNSLACILKDEGYFWENSCVKGQKIALIKCPKHLLAYLKYNCNINL